MGHFMVGRNATRILSCGLPRVFFEPWDKYDFIWLECMKYSCQGVQVQMQRKATWRSGQSYHGVAALVSWLTTVTALRPKAHA